MHFSLKWQALFYAIEYKYFDIVQLLLERGSSTEIQNNQGYKAKDWAIHVGFYRIEELIPTVVQYMLSNELSDYKTPADFAPTALQSVQYVFNSDGKVTILYDTIDFQACFLSGHNENAAKPGQR